MTPLVDAFVNSLASSLRGWRGTQVRHRAWQPEHLLRLYDIEACPYCRLVRETLTELDLDVLILPCPARGQRFRPQAAALGGKAQFPLLVDDNSGRVLYESADIVDYLRQRYGRRDRSWRGLLRVLTVMSSSVASVLALKPYGIAGSRVRHARPVERDPREPLELFSFESSPFSKRVRERLCELELPYRLRNTGKGHWRDLGPPSFRDRLFKGEMGTTRNRQWLAQNTGRVQVPYLMDINHEAAMYESQDILRYLDSTYAG